MSDYQKQDVQRFPGHMAKTSRFDSHDVRLSEWYDLTTDNATHMRFYKNGRVDVKFKDAVAAESCYRRLGLDNLADEE